MSYAPLDNHKFISSCNASETETLLQRFFTLYIRVKWKNASLDGRMHLSMEVTATGLNILLYYYQFIPNHLSSLTGWIYFRVRGYGGLNSLVRPKKNLLDIIILSTIPNLTMPLGAELDHKIVLNQYN